MTFFTKCNFEVESPESQKLLEKGIIDLFFKLDGRGDIMATIGFPGDDGIPGEDRQRLVDPDD